MGLIAPYFHFVTKEPTNQLKAQELHVFENQYNNKISTLRWKLTKSVLSCWAPKKLSSNFQNFCSSAIYLNRISTKTMFTLVKKNGLNAQTLPNNIWGYTIFPKRLAPEPTFKINTARPRNILLTISLYLQEQTTLGSLHGNNKRPRNMPNRIPIYSKAINS